VDDYGATVASSAARALQAKRVHGFAGGATVNLIARRSTPARSANHQLTDDSTTLAALLKTERPSCYERMLKSAPLLLRRTELPVRPQ
jgi:hypothetical protein